MDTSIDYSPWSLLPAPDPKNTNYKVDYFYENVAKHLIKDTVRIMANGIPINLDKVAEFEVTLNATLTKARTDLAANPYVIAYQQHRHKRLISEYITDRQSHCREASSFIKPFKYNDQTHRSYFMHIFAEQQAIAPPTDLLPTGIPKWPANTVKKLSASYPVLAKLLAGTLPPTHSICVQAMQLLAQHKADLHNRSYLDQIATPQIELPLFNPNSDTQLRELFAMLDIESDSVTKSGQPSWSRDEVERVGKQTVDLDVKSLVASLIDISFGDIIKNTFIPAFYKYTIDGRLYGNLKLFGAKSFRYTSSDPNLLNMPSTKSIYAKPLKKCFTAPDGYKVMAIDLSALEDRVMASLSRDTSKMAVFTDGLCGHCLNAYGYFPEEIKQFMPVTGDLVTDVKLFRELQSNGNKDLDAIRQKGKPATLTYKRLYTVMCIANYIYAGNSHL